MDRKGPGRGFGEMAALGFVALLAVRMWRQRLLRQSGSLPEGSSI